MAVYLGFLQVLKHLTVTDPSPRHCWWAVWLRSKLVAVPRCKQQLARDGPSYRLREPQGDLQNLTGASKRFNNEQNSPVAFFSPRRESPILVPHPEEESKDQRHNGRFMHVCGSCRLA